MQAGSIEKRIQGLYTINKALLLKIFDAFDASDELKGRRSMERKLLEEAKREFAYSISLRQRIHRNPELSFEEYETAALIKEELERMGVAWESVTETGIVATICGNVPPCRGKSKTIALRADMDALSITELTDVPFHSEVQGKMHACGHDLHVAMLLTAAKLLQQHRDQFCGTVKMIFQPAEEMVSGAKAMMAANPFFDGVDCVIGMHVMPSLLMGELGFHDGGFMFGGERFRIVIDGKSSHGSMPHTCVDALLAASAVVVNAQSIISENLPAKDSGVLTICTMKAGTRHNILAGHAEMMGTTRYYNEKERNLLKETLDRVVHCTAETFGARGHVVWDQDVPAVENDPVIGKILRTAAEKIVGEDHILEIGKQTGSDDFSYFSSKVPGYYLWLGCGWSDKENPMIHNEYFNPDENCMPIGAAVYVQAVMDFLRPESEV